MADTIRLRIPFTFLCTALFASACGGGGGGGGAQSPPAVSRPGSLQFQAGSFAVDENAGTASFTITRTGGSDGAVSVSVASSDGSANAAQDYNAVGTTVSFAAGDAAAKTVAVSITDDLTAEADETFTLTLSGASGGATLGGASAATLTIRDDDPPPAPVLTLGATIKQLTFTWAIVPGATSYRLLRDPDGASGFTQVGPDHPATAGAATLDIAVHRHDWVSARYRVDACNARGCSASNAMSALNLMLQSIGYFKASNSQSFDSLGFSLALSADGNTMAVGAPDEDSNATGVDGDQADNSAPFAGAVYVFVRDGTQWSQQAYLKASNAQADDKFGYCLDLSFDGATLAVAAVGESSSATGIDGNQNDNSASRSGAVYVFTRTAGQWSQQAYVKASNARERDAFGASLGLSADGATLGVGAPFESSSATGVGGNQGDNGANFAGAVYVFTRDAAQVWSQQAYVKASNTQAGDNFGFSLGLSLDGNTMAVGAVEEASGATGIDGDQADNGANGAGAAYVFTRTAGQWLQQAYVKASNTEAADAFGFSLALSGDGDTLAVGAPNEDSSARGVGGAQGDNSALFAGAAYIFRRTAGQWLQQAYVKASNAETLDQFGSALALDSDGSTLVVSGPGDDSRATGVGGDQADNSTSVAGAAYVFARTTGQWSQQAYVKAPNADISDQFALSLALSMDGTTLAVTAPGESSSATGVGGDQTNNDATRAGGAYVF